MKSVFRFRAVPVAVVVALMAATAPAHAQGPDGPQFTEEEVVRGIVLGQGPVAQEVGIASSDVDHAPEMQAQVDAFEESLVAEVLARPETAQALEQVASGDPWAVEDGLQTLSTVAQEETSSVASSLVGGPSVTPQCGFVAVCGAVSVAAFALGAVLVVVVGNVFMTVNAAVFSHYGDGSLSADEHVAAVTRGLDGVVVE